MTKPIKLTADDFIFTNNYPKKDPVLGIICPPEYSLPELKQQILENQEIVDRFLEIYKNHIRDGAPTNKPELTKVDQSVIDQIQNIITKQLEYIKDGSIPEGYTSIRKPGN